VNDDTVVVVRFMGAPVALMQRARLHLEAVTREFQLIEFSDNDADSPPARLLELITRMRSNYDALGFEGNRRFVVDAIERGDDAIDLELPVPSAGGPVARLLITTMEETDAWCERGALLTLASPADQRAMRRWFFGEIERQVAGDEPIPWPEFSDELEPRAAPTGRSRGARSPQ
jgi:hypothetical protein